MGGGENIYFSIIAFLLLLVFAIVWVIFRKRQKVVWFCAFVMVGGFVGYYSYYPTMLEHTHQQRLLILNEYLDKTYPTATFDVRPQQLEAGDRLGDFYVHHVESPYIGVILRVTDDEQVTQIGMWDATDYPSQEELWRKLTTILDADYTLGQTIANIKMHDYWLEDALTVFAVTIDEKLALALFHYTAEGYGFISLTYGNQPHVVTASYEDFVFVYVEADSKIDVIPVTFTSGEQHMLDTTDHKGQILVKKLEEL